MIFFPPIPDGILNGQDRSPPFFIRGSGSWLWFKLVRLQTGTYIGVLDPSPVDDFDPTSHWIRHSDPLCPNLKPTISTFTHLSQLLSSNANHCFLARDSVSEAPALNCSLCSAQSADGPGTLIRCVKLGAHNLQFTFLK